MELMRDAAGMKLIRDAAGIRLLQPPLPGKSRSGGQSHREDPSQPRTSHSVAPLLALALVQEVTSVSPYRVWHSSHSTRAEALPGLVWHSEMFLAPKELKKF